MSGFDGLTVKLLLIFRLLLFCFPVSETGSFDCDKPCDLRGQTSQMSGWSQFVCEIFDYCWEDSQGCEISCHLGYSVHTVQILYNVTSTSGTGGEGEVYQAGSTGGFGYNMETSDPVAGRMAIPEPADGCETVTNLADLEGKIALIDRGDCTFVAKITNAQNAGAVGVIIIDNNGGSSFDTSGLFTMGGSGAGITIPALFLYNTEGTELKSKLQSNPDILVYLGLRRVEEGTSCGPAPDVTPKNATTQYTVDQTTDGVTAAYVCNEGLLWADGARVVYAHCTGGQWSPLGYNSTVLESGCEALTIPEMRTQPRVNFTSLEFPVLTDGNHSSCVNVTNPDPIGRKLVDVTLFQNQESDGHLNITVSFNNITSCDIMRSEITLHRKVPGSCCISCKFLRLCRLTRDRSYTGKCDVTCACAGQPCELGLLLNPLAGETICEFSVEP